MVKKKLIGESSWDVECFLHCMGKLDYFYIHNDFFTESTKNNTKFSRRLFVLIKVLYHTAKSILTRQDIYFSSLNFEVLIVALIVSFSKRTYIFLPNVIGDISEYGKLFQQVVNRYKGRVIVSDSVTSKTLGQNIVSISPEMFTFNLPCKSERAKLVYIVVLPAAHSHSSTKDLGNEMYNFTAEIFELLSSKYKVYILPHPRDKEYTQEKYSNTVTNEEIAKFGSNVCYISGASSLSLNRRYGGDYGCWVSIGGQNALPRSLQGCEELLTDIRYFVD
jgi:hypothetical protein